MIAMASYGLSARAQISPSENFIYLFNDSVIHARSIRLRPDFNNSLQIRADSRRIPVEQVKFFNNQDGFYANTKRITFGGFSEFAERIVEGRINLYQQVTYDPFLYDYGYRFREIRQQPVDIRMFYNKGYNDLKKVSYANLKGDMADRRESMELLETYRKSVNRSTLLYTAAGASVLAGLISFVVNAKQDNHQDFGSFNGNGFNQNFNRRGTNFTASFVLLGASAGFALGGYAIGVNAKRHLEHAVDAYNR